MCMSLLLLCFCFAFAFVFVLFCFVLFCFVLYRRMGTSSRENSFCVRARAKVVLLKGQAFEQTVPNDATDLSQ